MSNKFPHDKTKKKGGIKENNEQVQRKPQNEDNIKSAKKTLRRSGTKLLLDTPFTVQAFLLDTGSEARLINRFVNLVHEHRELKFPVVRSGRNKPIEIDPDFLARGKQYRSELVFGANAVIRAVEKGQLVGVILSYPTKLPLLLQHVVPLCASRGCPCICIAEWNENVAPEFGLASMLALGFKACTLEPSSIFHTIISEIRSQAPDPQQIHKELFANKAEDSTTLPTSSVNSKSSSCEKADDVPKDATVSSEMGLTFANLYIKKSNTPVAEKRPGADFLSLNSEKVVEMEENYFPNREAPNGNLSKASISVVEDEVSSDKSVTSLNPKTTIKSLLAPNMKCFKKRGRPKKRKSQDV